MLLPLLEAGLDPVPVAMQQLMDRTLGLRPGQKQQHLAVRRQGDPGPAGAAVYPHPVIERDCYA